MKPVRKHASRSSTTRASVQSAVASELESPASEIAVGPSRLPGTALESVAQPERA
jgi:hypothetical protein